MSKYSTNSNGIKYYLTYRKRIIQHICLSPILVGGLSFLMFLGADSYIYLLIVSWFTLCYGIILFLFIIIRMLAFVNKITSSIEMRENSVQIETFNILCKKSKKDSCDIKDIKLIPHNIDTFDKKQESAFRVKINSKEYYLIKAFFDEDIETILKTKLNNINNIHNS